MFELKVKVMRKCGVCGNAKLCVALIEITGNMLAAYTVKHEYYEHA